MLSVPDTIKDLFHTDSVNKNIRIQFPNGERADICNDQIVKDSVEFTESLCSQNTLKFGLCESPVFQCNVIGVGNITDATIEVYCEIYCDSTVEDAVWRNDLEQWVYPVFLGSFIVQSAERQADMIHRKIVAYSFVYNRMSLIDVSKSLTYFYASQIVNSNANYSTSLEWLIFGTFPYLFNEKAFNYTQESFILGYTTENGEIPCIRNGQYTSITVKREYYRASADDRIMVVNYSDLDVESRQDISATIQDATDYWASLYPTVTNLDGDPLDIYDELKKIMGVAMFKPITNAVRSDYVQNGQPTRNYLKTEFNKLVTMPTECDYNVYIFGGYSVAGYGGNEYKVNLIGSNAFLYSIPTSELSLNTYALKRNKDSIYNAVVTIKGYSARKAFEKLDIMKLAQGFAELKGTFWAFARGYVKEINLKQQFGLLPSSTLYPGQGLYPEGVIGGKLLPKDYQSCWYKDDYIKPFGAVKCSYKDTNDEDVIFTLYLPGFDKDTPTSTYQTYNLSDNYIIQSGLWTQARIQSLCEVIANNLSGVTYMPVEFVGRGLPYVEAGDTFEILTKSNDSITTIVLNRTIKGENHLVDSYKSV